jgi:hypothetical protein
MYPNSDGAGLFARSVCKGLLGKEFSGEVPAPSPKGREGAKAPRLDF